MNTIKSFRKSQKLTQPQLAELTNSTQSNISHLETGRRQITVAFAKDLIEVAKKRGVELTLEQIFADMDSSKSIQ